MLLSRATAVTTDAVWTISWAGPRCRDGQPGRWRWSISKFRGDTTAESAVKSKNEKPPGAPRCRIGGAANGVSSTGARPHMATSPSSFSRPAPRRPIALTARVAVNRSATRPPTLHSSLAQPNSEAAAEYTNHRTVNVVRYPSNNNNRGDYCNTAFRVSLVDDHNSSSRKPFSENCRFCRSDAALSVESVFTMTEVSKETLKKEIAGNYDLFTRVRFRFFLPPPVSVGVTAGRVLPRISCGVVPCDFSRGSPVIRRRYSNRRRRDRRAFCRPAGLKWRLSPVVFDPAASVRAASTMPAPPIGRPSRRPDRWSSRLSRRPPIVSASERLARTPCSAGPQTAR